MTDTPTRPSLLVRLRDPADREAWAQFVELYAPLVYGYGRKHGLQDADAADLTQTVLGAVAASVGRLAYDPERGTFRGWLFTVVRNKLRNFHARRSPACEGTGDPAVQQLLEAQADGEAAAGWDEDWRHRVFTWAAGRVRRRTQDTTWQAFWQTTVDGRPPREVAERLGVRVAAVYLARSRVLARLRAEIAQLPDDDRPEGFPP